MTKTDEQGRFQLLADQQAILTVSMPGQAPLILDDLGKRVVAEGDPPNTFRLPRGVRPQGRVTKFDGTPVPGAVVSIRRNAPYNEFNMPVFFSRNCAADGNGEYQLPPVPAGSYLMSVSSALEDVAQCDEFNRPEDFRSHPRLMLATTSVPTRPLTEVILGTVQAFGEEDEQPQVDFRAVETYSIDVRIEREEGVDPTNRVVDLTVRGFLGKDRWSGRSVKAGPDGIARLTVPKGIDNVVIGTGLARHRREPDGPEEIGEAIHLGHVDGNISGIVVTQPALAKLVVDVTYSKPTTNIGLSSWHVRHGFKDQGGKKQPIYLVASRQTGNYQYRGTALPDEDIIFQVYRRDKGTFQVLHKQQLRLNAGEERSLKVKIQVP